MCLWNVPSFSRGFSQKPAESKYKRLGPISETWCGKGWTNSSVEHASEFIKLFATVSHWNIHVSVRIAVSEMANYRNLEPAILFYFRLDIGDCKGTIKLGTLPRPPRLLASTGAATPKDDTQKTKGVTREHLVRKNKGSSAAKISSQKYEGEDECGINKEKDEDEGRINSDLTERVAGPVVEC